MNARIGELFDAILTASLRLASMVTTEGHRPISPPQQSLGGVRYTLIRSRV